MKMPFKRTLRVKLFVIILLGLILSISAFFAGTFALNSYMKNVYMSDTERNNKLHRSRTRELLEASYEPTDAHPLGCRILFYIDITVIIFVKICHGGIHLVVEIFIF